MKKNISRIAIIVAAMVGLYSCKRDFTLKSPADSPTGSAYLRVIDASPGFRSIYNLPDSFNVYVGSNKITGFTPGGTYLMTFGATFPTVSSLFGYVAVPAGTQPIKLTFGGVLTGDSIPITTFSKTLAADQYYSLVVTDSIKSTRDSSQIFVQDSYTGITVPAPAGYYAVRFMHAVMNDTAGKTVDVFSYARNALISTNVKPGGTTAFQTLGVNISVADTFYVTRSAASTVPLSGRVVLAKLAFTPTNQRIYTLLYRGDGNLTTGTKARTLTNYINQ